MFRKTTQELLRSLTKAQKERASLARLGLKGAEERAHRRVQEYRALVRDLRSMSLPRAASGSVGGAQ